MATTQQVTEWDETGKPIGGTAPTEWDEHGKPVTAAAPATTAPIQKQPARGYEFGKDVGRGMGFDVDKAERMETDPSGGKHPLKGGLELAKQFMQSGAQWMEASAKDPAHLLDPIHAVASGVTRGLGLPDRPGEPYSKPNVGQLTGSLALVGAGVDRPEAPPVEVAHASKLLDRQIALNKGRVGLVNDVKRAGSLLENAVTGEQGEVGRHAQAVIAADKADLARTQSEGKVGTAGATLAGQAVHDKTKMGGVAGGYPPNLPLDSAKALITQLGREASRLERGNKAPEAAAVWAEYDGLRKATQERANALGTQFGASWQHYIKEFHNYVQLNKGLFGHIMNDADHIGILKKLTSGDFAAQLPEIKDWMRKYGVDSEPLDYAIKQGQKLEELSAQSKNMFMGKLRAIARHPIAAGGTAAVSAVAGHATGIPGMGFVLPLLLAGKVAGIIDARDAANLLRSITRKVGPAMERVTPEAEGPRPLPQPPTGGGTAPATEEDWQEEARRRAPGAAPTEPEPQSEREARDVEAAKRKEATTKAAMSAKSELAGKLQGARTARASGVYGGKRGSTRAEQAATTMSTGPVGGQDYQRALKGRRLREYFEKKKEGK